MAKENRKIFKIIKVMVICVLFLSMVIFCAIFIAHSAVFSRADYDQYDTEHYLLYEDIDVEKYPREQIVVQSEENTISAFYYPTANSEGLIIVAPGHRDSNDIKLYEICYFIDACYSVICLDYTGCYSSGGDSMRGYSQYAYDLSAIDGINSVTIPVLIISAEDDIFYGGLSPLYDKQNEIMNPNCTFVLMDEENHNGHYDYFLTDAALEYQAENPTVPIDKELYMEHDANVMNMMIDYLESK